WRPSRDRHNREQPFVAKLNLFCQFERTLPTTAQTSFLECSVEEKRNHASNSKQWLWQKVCQVKECQKERHSSSRRSNSDTEQCHFTAWHFEQLLQLSGYHVLSEAPKRVRHGRN